jgi:hypothetical protein
VAIGRGQDEGRTQPVDAIGELAELICAEAHEIAVRGGGLEQMVLDLLAKAGTQRSPVEQALELCSGPSAADEQARHLLRRALQTGLFES